MAQVSADVVQAGNIWVEFFRTGLPGLAIVIGAIGTLVTSLLALRRNIKNGEKQNEALAQQSETQQRIEVIQKQTNGHLSRLQEAFDQERAARIANELELRTVYSVFSARLRMPVADLRQMIREEDARLLPPQAPERPRRPAPSPLPKRRRTDKPKLGERQEDPKS